MNIIEHAEKFLGKISQGWEEKTSPDGLQVVCFDDVPFETLYTFMTAGLSLHELRMSDERKVRQELIFSISATGVFEMMVSLLLFICELILKNHDAVLRGQILRLPIDAAEKIGFDAVYFAIPVFLDDEFATFGGSQPPTVVVWVIPIYKSEADYVDENGWSKFEDLLAEKDPDLFSLERVPII